MGIYMKRIENSQFDEERSLYNIKNTLVTNCIFAGPKDGESVLKETREIKVNDCQFSLRYPLWHAKKYELVNSYFDKDTRAPIWYSDEGLINNCTFKGIKLLRECHNTTIRNSRINSIEFGWKCSNIEVEDCDIDSEYIFLDSNDISLKNTQFKGKYSFQYIKHLVIDHCQLDTKDAFWHSEDIIVRNSLVKGEYLGWFSKNLTLINCQIIGTQPLCYCENLKLINCTMEACDLSFEYSDVEADIIGHVDSIKNPKSGTITLDSLGELIEENSIMETSGKVIIRKNHSL